MVSPASTPGKDGVQRCAMLYESWGLRVELGQHVFAETGYLAGTDEQRLADIMLDWRDEWAVSVVLASKGYPIAYEKGFEISGIDKAEALENVIVYHAGTALDDEGHLVTSGGRVLNVTALGDSFEHARELAYRGVDLIDFEGKQFRTDIGARALRGRDAWDV